MEMTTRNKFGIALTVALGLFPVVLDSTIVNVALVPISKELHSDLNNIQWISIGYLLSNAAVVGLSGYLGERFGLKRLFMVGLVLFTLFSFLCGVAPSESWLIAFRVLQGTGGGMLIPLGTALAFENFSKEERPKVMAVIGIPLLLGPVVGPIIGGWMVDNLNWQTIFFVNVPICLLAILLSWLILPRDEIKVNEHQAKFDYLGLVLSTIGVVLVVYAFKLVTQTNPDTVSTLKPGGEIYGWGYWPVWALLGGGLILLLTYGVYALRFSRDPVMDLRLFKSYNFTIGSIVTWVGASVSFGVMFLLPVFFQQVRLPHLSAIDTGFAMMPLGAGTLIGIVAGGGLYHRLGTRILVAGGSLLFVLSFWQLTSLTPTSTSDSIWLWLFLMGVALSLTGVVTQTLALEALTGSALSKASSLFGSTKMLMASVGAAVLATIFIQQTTSHAEQLRNQLLQKLPAGVTPDPNSPQVAALRDQLGAQAGTSAITDVFTILIYCAAILAVISLALPGRQPTPNADAPKEEAPSLLAS